MASYLICQRRTGCTHTLRSIGVCAGKFFFRGGQFVPSSLDLYMALEFCNQVGQSVKVKPSDRDIFRRARRARNESGMQWGCNHGFAYHYVMPIWDHTYRVTFST
jgi:hypothetical protein